MKEIQLTKGFTALVDDEDFELLSKHKWGVLITGRNKIYARRGITVRGKKIAILMHRIILNVPIDFQVDHINGNSLDNRKENLRICTSQQNSMNRKNTKSLAKGVRFRKDHKKFQARIVLNGKEKHLGYFNSCDEAAKAYNKAALEYFGSFAKLNEES